MRILAPIALIVVVVVAVLLFTGGDKQTYNFAGCVAENRASTAA